MTVNTNLLDPTRLNPFGMNSVTPQEKLRLLDSYYNNNLLYNRGEVNAVLNNVPLEAMKPIKTPVNRAVEFYVAKVATGKPKIYSTNAQLIDSVSKFLNWSNFEDTKTDDIRKVALYGYSFKKVVSTLDKVFQETVAPETVTAFEVDSRGYITEIRVDTLVYVNGMKMTRTEYWTLTEGGYMAVWVHNMGVTAKVDSLGTPEYFAYLAEFGIDFIPFVVTKFRKTSDKYAKGCVEHAIAKVDEENRMATRLHQTLFRYNKPLWAVSANSTDTQGRPMPAPKIKDPVTGATANSIDAQNNDILYLPGNSSLESLIPDIKYAEALAILEAQQKEIEQDLPELLYYSLGENQRSGIALRTVLASAVDRAIGLEENFIQSQVRLDMMALTIGAFLGIFPNFGSFDDDKLQHGIKFNEMFPLTPDEKATALAKLPPEIPIASRMRLAGYDEDEIVLVTGVENPIS